MIRFQDGGPAVDAGVYCFTVATTDSFILHVRIGDGSNLHLSPWHIHSILLTMFIINIPVSTRVYRAVFTFYNNVNRGFTPSLGHTCKNIVFSHKNGGKCMHDATMLVEFLG